MKKKTGKGSKQSHSMFSKYVPLNCACCGKDILEAMHENPYCANVVFVIKNDVNYPEKTYVEDMYWACKGKCDREVKAQYKDRGLITTWQDIGDVVIPLVYLKWFMATINNLKEGRYIYTEEAFKKEKDFLIALSQKVFKEMTAEEIKRAIKFEEIESLMI